MHRTASPADGKQHGGENEVCGGSAGIEQGFVAPAGKRAAALELHAVERKLYQARPLAHSDKADQMPRLVDKAAEQGGGADAALIEYKGQRDCGSKGDVYFQPRLAYISFHRHRRGRAAAPGRP